MPGQSTGSSLDWVGGYRYVRNRQPLRLVDNTNRTIELASGDWVMQLGDDDLLPGAGVTTLDGIRGARPEEAVLLLVVDIVTALVCAAIHRDSCASSTLKRRWQWSG